MNKMSDSVCTIEDVQKMMDDQLAHLSSDHNDAFICNMAKIDRDRDGLFDRLSSK